MHLNAFDIFTSRHIDIKTQMYETVSKYSEIRLKETHRDHENMFIITGVPYKRIVN